MVSEVNLSPAERIILAVDVSTESDAERLLGIAQQAGARFVKLGLELQTATSWAYCSDIAAAHGLDWVADAKLDDIPNTVAGAVNNIINKSHAPFGITMHTNAGFDSMKLAQEVAGDVIMFGVTELTSIPPAESYSTYSILDEQTGKVAPMEREELVKRRAHKAALAGLKGIVAGPKEVGFIKQDPVTEGMFAMIPGTRSPGADSHDQANVETPTTAIRNGAGLLVIGREITKADDPAAAFQNIVRQIGVA